MIKRLLSGYFQNGKSGSASTIRKIYGTLAFGWFVVLLGAAGAMELDTVSLTTGALLCVLGLVGMYRCLYKSGVMDDE